MQQLNTVKRRAAPKALINAVDSCIIPVAKYGAEVWWPGLSRPTTKETVRPATSFHCDLINKVIIKALRIALPVSRTTLNVVLPREGGIPPTRIPLERYRIRLAARLNSLHGRHPLLTRKSVCPNVNNLKFKRKPRLSKKPEIQMSCVQRSHRQLPQSESLACSLKDMELYNGEEIYACFDNQAAVMTLTSGNSTSSILTKIFHCLVKSINAEFNECWVTLKLVATMKQKQKLGLLLETYLRD